MIIGSYLGTFSDFQLQCAAWEGKKDSELPGMLWQDLNLGFGRGSKGVSTRWSVRCIVSSYHEHSESMINGIDGRMHHRRHRCRQDRRHSMICDFDLQAQYDQFYWAYPDLSLRVLYGPLGLLCAIGPLSLGAVIVPFYSSIKSVRRLSDIGILRRVGVKKVS